MGVEPLSTSRRSARANKSALMESGLKEAHHLNRREFLIYHIVYGAYTIPFIFFCGSSRPVNDQTVNLPCFSPLVGRVSPPVGKFLAPPLHEREIWWKSKNKLRTKLSLKPCREKYL